MHAKYFPICVISHLWACTASKRKQMPRLHILGGCGGDSARHFAGCRWVGGDKNGLMSSGKHTSYTRPAGNVTLILSGEQPFLCMQLIDMLSLGYISFLGLHYTVYQKGNNKSRYEQNILLGVVETRHGHWVCCVSLGGR